MSHKKEFDWGDHDSRLTKFDLEISGIEKALRCDGVGLTPDERKALNARLAALQGLRAMVSARRDSVLTQTALVEDDQEPSS